MQDASVHKDMKDWISAFNLITKLNSEMAYGHNDWRVPNIIEFDSLTDMLITNCKPFCDGEMPFR